MGYRIIKAKFVPKKRKSMSGKKGVTWQPKSKNWAAKINFDHKKYGTVSIFIGNFETIDEAYKARIDYLDAMK